jgi:hypothetical protein
VQRRDVRTRRVQCRVLGLQRHCLGRVRNAHQRVELRRVRNRVSSDVELRLPHGAWDLLLRERVRGHRSSMRDELHEYRDGRQ